DLFDRIDIRILSKFLHENLVEEILTFNYQKPLGVNVTIQSFLLAGKLQILLDPSRVGGVDKRDIGVPRERYPIVIYLKYFDHPATGRNSNYPMFFPRVVKGNLVSIWMFLCKWLDCNCGLNTRCA